MSVLSTVSETLYVPLLGRIYASKHHPDILFDNKALAISERLPQNIKEMPGQTEYTSLASAVRSTNIDHYLRDFLVKYPNGTIVNAGCGLETIYYRNDNGKALWFELDLPDVLELRRSYFPEEMRDRYLPYSIFDDTWITSVKKTEQGPVMVIAAGLFHYFKEEQVIDFIRRLTRFEHVQLVFDAVSSVGIKGSRYYVKKMGKQEARMFFSVDNVKAFATKLPDGVNVIEERRFYSLVKSNAKIAFSTKVKMCFSDAFNMVKMAHLIIK